MALVVGTGGIGATLMGGLALAGEVTAAAMFGAPVVAFSAAGVIVIAATSYIKGTFATIAEKIPDMPAFLKRKKNEEPSQQGESAMLPFIQIILFLLSKQLQHHYPLTHF
jgi:hypothetical protein